jgi:hypothetical protein
VRAQVLSCATSCLANHSRAVLTGGRIAVGLFKCKMVMEAEMWAFIRPSSAGHLEEGMLVSRNRPIFMYLLPSTVRTSWRPEVLLSY